MSGTLAGRCRAFLARPVPEGVDYVPGSIAEGMLARAARGLSLDEEAAELLEICVMETRAAAEAHTGAARAWLEESAMLLEEIAAG